MALKDYFAADAATFINAAEFAFSHVINGKSMDVVVDNDLYQDRQQSLNNPEGYFPITIAYHVAASVFGAKPAVNSIQKFDGKPYRVAEVQEDMGMYYISLYEGEYDIR